MQSNKTILISNKNWFQNYLMAQYKLEVALNMKQQKENNSFLD